MRAVRLEGMKGPQWYAKDLARSNLNAPGLHFYNNHTHTASRAFLLPCFDRNATSCQRHDASLDSQLTTRGKQSHRRDQEQRGEQSGIFSCSPACRI
jgi:hypothetical protein